MRSSTLSLAVSVAVAALLTSACGASGPSNSSNSGEDTYTVGAVLPLSGPYASVGQAELAGLKVAIQELNSDGGVLGRKVTLVERDSQSNAQRGTLAAKDLIEKDHPDFIVPGTVSSVSNAIMPVVMQAKTIAAAPLTTFADPEQFPYFFQTYYTGDQQADAYSAAVEELYGKDAKVGILVGNDPSGHTIAEGMKTHLDKRGIAVAGDESFEPDSSDVTVQLAKLKADGATVVFVHALGEKDLGTIMKGVRDLNWASVNVLGDASSITVNLQKAIPAEVANQFRVVGSRIYARPSKPAVGDFITALTEGGATQGLEPASLIHDALKIVAWATEKAETTDAGEVRSVLEGLGSDSADHSSLRDEVLVLKDPGFTSEYHGLSAAGSEEYWAVMKVSESINGTYEGDPLELQIAP